MVVENLNAKQKISSVVLVAAPEGGLDSLGWVFSGLPGGLEAAFIVAVPSYSESTDKLRDVIAGTSGLNIKIVQEKEGLEPDTIHILPTDRVSTLKKSRFALDQERNMQGLIDSFLLSLASDQGEKAIGIILSGLNGDGTLGLTALKAAGGLALAELVGGVSPDPPNPTGVADHLVPREQIVEHLVSHLEHRGDREESLDNFKFDPEEIRGIAAILRNKTGQDFHNYKQTTFLRRVQRRMQINQIDTVATYIDFLRSDAEEANDLFQDLLMATGSPSLSSSSLCSTIGARRRLSSCSSRIPRSGKMRWSRTISIPAPCVTSMSSA
jgi:two-component system, chemotaxis family, CheB/CheR fusion protein